MIKINAEVMAIALNEIGVTEVPGGKHNPRILEYFAEIGHEWVDDDETAWCAAFANYVLKMAGINGSGKLNARSFLDVGHETKTPAIGDLVVFWRESPKSWKGHIAFFVRETEEYVYVLGGNQRNKVSIQAYPRKRLLEYRRI